MYKISEFSKITGLTVKTLRYYDEEGILKPSSRAENSYRFYNDQDFTKAQLVILLRDLSFSIAEMKEITACCESPEDLSYYLAEKQRMIADQISKEKELIKRIDHYLQTPKTEVGSMNYDIGCKEFGELNVLSVRYKGKYSDVGKYIGTLFQEGKGKISGPPFCCYYDPDYQEEADIELCLTMKGKVTGVKSQTKLLPKIKGLSTLHTGSYETLNLAYKAILDYAREHDLSLDFPSREIYHKGPGLIFKGNPHKYITEIVIPIKQEDR